MVDILCMTAVCILTPYYQKINHKKYEQNIRSHFSIQIGIFLWVWELYENFEQQFISWKKKSADCCLPVYFLAVDTSAYIIVIKMIR